MHFNKSDYFGKVVINRIAKKYDAAEDNLKLIAKVDIDIFRQIIQKQFADISNVIYFDFVNHDPYPYVNISEVMDDFRNRKIQVNTSGNDSELWGKVYNLQFRAIHDYFHCKHSLSFNYFAEVHAFEFQINETQEKYQDIFPYANWDLFQRVLRSEIIYQAAVKSATEKFHIEQKIVLSDLV